MNVVSLLPSATEICYALGVEPVGVSHSCDHPPAARGLPSLTESRIDTDADAAAIDEQVREIEGTTYALRADLLADLDPDVILTQGTCEVCAVDATVVHETVAERSISAEVVSLDPHTVGDVLDDMERVGRAVGREDRAASLVADYERRLRRATHDPASRPRTVVFDWTDPPMLAGHWVPGLVERAGGVMDRPTDHRTAPSAPVEWSWVREYDPEVIVAAPCGFEQNRARDAIETLQSCPGWADLSAVRNDAVYAADGSGLFNRPGPRLVATLVALRAALDPDRSVADADGIQRVTERIAPAD